MKIALTCSIKPENLTPEDREKYAEFDSRGTINDLADAIKANGHDIEVIDVRKNIRDVLISKKNEIDLVFNVAEGIEGEEREALVPGVCEELGIPFSGAGFKTSVIVLNKAKAKEVLVKENIPTPRFQIFNSWEEELRGLSFPLLVKPMLEGSSRGIFNDNLVDNLDDLKKIVKKLVRDYKQPVIVEEFINGREFTVAVIGYKNPVILPIVEIKFDHLPDDLHPMDSYEAKWIYDSPEIIENNPDKDPLVCPAKISDGLKKKIEETVLNTYKALDCKDWARIDVRLDKDGIPNILEVNTPPGFMKDPLENSRLPKAAYANGWSYEKLIGEVLDSAIKRWGL